MDAPIGAYRYNLVWGAWKSSSSVLIYTKVESPVAGTDKAYSEKSDSATQYTISSVGDDNIVVGGVTYDRFHGEDTTYFVTVRITDEDETSGTSTTYDLYVARFLANNRFDDGTGYFNDSNISNKFGILYAWKSGTNVLVYTTMRNPKNGDTLYQISGTTVTRFNEVIQTRKYGYGGVLEIKTAVAGWFERSSDDNNEDELSVNSAWFDTTEQAIDKIKNIFKLDKLKFIYKDGFSAPIGFLGCVRTLDAIPANEEYRAQYHNLANSYYDNPEINRRSGLEIQDSYTANVYSVLNDAGLNLAGTCNMLLATSNSVVSIVHEEFDNSFTITYVPRNTSGGGGPGNTGYGSTDNYLTVNLGTYQISNYAAWPLTTIPRVNDCKMWGDFTSSFYNKTLECGADINTEVRSLRPIKIAPRKTQYCQGFAFDHSKLAGLTIIIETIINLSNKIAKNHFEIIAHANAPYEAVMRVSAVDVYGIIVNEEKTFSNLWDNSKLSTVLFPARYNVYISGDYRYIDLLGQEHKYVHRPMSIAYKISGSNETEEDVMWRAAYRYVHGQYILNNQVDSIDSSSIRNGTDNAYNKPNIVNEWEYYSVIESLLPTALYSQGVYQEILIPRTCFKATTAPSKGGNAEEVAFCLFNPTSEVIQYHPPEGENEAYFEGIDYRYLGISNNLNWANGLINMSNMIDIPSSSGGFCAAIVLEGYLALSGFQPENYPWGVWVVKLYVPNTAQSDIIMTYARDIKSLLQYYPDYGNPEYQYLGDDFDYLDGPYSYDI